MPTTRDTRRRGTFGVSHALVWRQLSFLVPAAVFVANTSVARTWVQDTNAPSLYQWTSIACSADGGTLVAGSDHLIYYSTNRGQIWNMASAPAANWAAVACSADGITMIAAAGQWQNGPVYVSTNAGASWFSSGLATDYWSAVTCSADGTKMAAGAGYVAATGNIYISTNSGAKWNRANTPANYWTSIASSADGSMLAAGAGLGIYLSRDFGSTWTTANAPQAFWTCLWTSTNGHTLIAGAGIPGAQPGPVYTSIDSGFTWSSNDLPVTKWVGVAASANASSLVAVVQGGTVNYTSMDEGLTWVSNNVAGGPASPNAGCASSADGNVIFVVSGAKIFFRQSATKPTLRLANSAGGQLAASWLVPSSVFSIQECSDATLTKWSVSPQSPTLDYKTLEYRVFIAATNSHAFYRLAGP